MKFLGRFLLEGVLIPGKSTDLNENYSGTDFFSYNNQILRVMKGARCSGEKHWRSVTVQGRVYIEHSSQELYLKILSQKESEVAESISPSGKGASD